MALLLLLLAGTCPAQTAFPDGLPRDPLEVRALTDPEGVLKVIPAAVRQAEGAPRRQALLYLAQANACRVIANWHCQKDAGARATAAAKVANDIVLTVRGLIAESRADISLKDYSRGTRLLTEAEVLMKSRPLPELSADIDLAYSSMSYSLGKLARSAEYANRGLLRLGVDRNAAMRGRLLRNLARAQAQLGNTVSAFESLQRAQALAEEVGDPKLVGEVALETARLAHLGKNISLQRTSAAHMLASASRLGNSQLEGLAHEVLGDAALDEHDSGQASAEYRHAIAAFQALHLDRDELRASRSLARTQALMAMPKTDSDRLLARILDLGESIETNDRAQAADDLGARVRYLQQQQSLAGLQREHALLEQREIVLTRYNHLIFWLAIAAAATLLVFAALYWQLRRVHQRLRDAFKSLHESESRATSLLNLSQGCIFLHDDTGTVISTNPAAAAALRRSPEGMVGRPLQGFLPNAVSKCVAHYLDQVTSKGLFEGTLILLDDDRHERHWRITSTYVKPPNVQAFVVGNAVDITDQARQIEELSEQNLRDELTGVYNRRQLDRFELDHPASSEWAVIAIDLDDFKGINDSFGHERGDEILMQVAGFLMERSRSQDTVVRQGGDEFVILMTDANLESVGRLVDRLEQDMPSLECRFTIGSAMREGDEILAATIARADMAMIEAKHLKGRFSRRTLVAENDPTGSFQQDLRSRPD